MTNKRTLHHNRQISGNNGESAQVDTGSAFLDETHLTLHQSRRDFHGGKRMQQVLTQVKGLKGFRGESGVSWGGFWVSAKTALTCFLGDSVTPLLRPCQHLPQTLD